MLLRIETVSVEKAPADGNFKSPFFPYGRLSILTFSVTKILVFLFSHDFSLSPQVLTLCWGQL